VLSNVSPRNFVLNVFAISLFLYVTCKSVRDLVLVTNCICCVLSAFSDNRLVVKHLFISWRILFAVLAKSVGFRLVIIMLVLLVIIMLVLIAQGNLVHLFAMKASNLTYEDVCF
jgi:hypothetical protein